MARARPEDRGRSRCVDATRLLAVPETRERQRRASPHFGESAGDLSFTRTGQGLGQDLDIYRSLLSFARPHVGWETPSLRSLLRLDGPDWHRGAETAGLRVVGKSSCIPESIVGTLCGFR